MNECKSQKKKTHKINESLSEMLICVILLIYIFLLVDANPFFIKSKFYVNLFLYKRVALMKGRLTTWHLVACIILTGLY